MNSKTKKYIFNILTHAVLFFLVFGLVFSPFVSYIPFPERFEKVAQKFEVYEAYATTDVFTLASGTNSAGYGSWVVPGGVTSAIVACWGGGGGGKDGTDGGGGKGGGGGGFASSTVSSLVAGTQYTIFIGAGGAGGTSDGAGQNGATSTFATTTVIAAMGQGGTGDTTAGGTGGLASHSTGTTKANGGNGGDGTSTNDLAGGGGGAGGPHGAGDVGGNGGGGKGGAGGQGDNAHGGAGGAQGNGGAGGAGGANDLGGGGGGGGDTAQAGGAGAIPGGGGGAGEAGGEAGKSGRCEIVYTATTGLTQDGYRWRANHQGETGTMWLAAEDTVLTGANNTTASTTRLRILVDETAGTATTTLYQLEYATSTSAGCSALTYMRVADQASTSAYAWKMSPTSQFANGGATTNIADPNGLTDPTGSFRAGVTQDTVARISSGIAHAAGEFTELEWSIEGTALTNGASYCFRVTNADDTTNFTYSAYPKINMASTTALSQAHYRWRANNGGESAGGDWWDSDFQNRRKITFNNAPSSENLHNFPVPIKLTADANDEWGAANIDYSKTVNHGFDVRFVNASSTLMLKHEVESWDETGTSTVWVKLPFLEAATTSQYIWMYYNNSATTTSGTATSSVWDSNFAGVWHLAATSTAARKFGDSTSNANNGIGTNFDSDEYTTGGRINGALNFDGTDDWVNLGTSFDISALPFTISAWVKADDFGDNATIFAKRDGYDAANMRFNMTTSITDGDILFQSQTSSLNTTYRLTAGRMTHIAFVPNAGSTLFYVDGKLQETLGGFTLGTDATALTSMGRTDNGASDIHDGIIDEVRTSNITRSADWIQQEYRYGAASSTTHAYGAEETVGSGASWLADEDIHLSSGSNATASTTRLRILVDETTALIATTTLYQLEYATSTIAGYTGCANLSTWVIVANQASSTSYAWKMSPTARFANGAASTNNSNLTDPTGSFRAGVTQDTASRISSGIAHSAGEFTELEWSVEATSEAAGDSYCFRVTNADDTTNFTYSAYARISIASSTAYTQNRYQLYKDNNLLNPTTVWDGLAENAPMTSANERVGGGDVVRLRMNVTVSGSALSANNTSFSIQYAELPSGSSCSALTNWAPVGAKGGDVTFRLANTSQGDSTTITSTLLSDSNVGGLLSELNPSATNPNAVTVSQKVEYDWPIEYASARFSNATICFRMVEGSATTFATYTQYPQILTNIVGAGDSPVGGSGAKGAATTTGGTSGGSGETGGSGAHGAATTTGGTQSGGGEVWIPFFRYFASALGGVIEFVVQVLRL